MGGFCADVEPRRLEPLILSLCKGCESERHQERSDDSENPRGCFPESSADNCVCFCRQETVANEYRKFCNQSDQIKRNLCKDYCPSEQQKIKGCIVADGDDKRQRKGHDHYPECHELKRAVSA